MKKKIVILICFIFICYAFSKNEKDHYPTNLPRTSYPVPRAEDSNIVLLGRLLFFDPILSFDSSISCASCHAPHNAFAHTDHELSHGINDLIGQRNAPALFNLAWHKQFMWDGAVNHIEVQALAPITHPKEMGENLEHVLLKLNRSGFYRHYFYYAFKDSNILSKNILLALAAFQLQLISTSTKYDQVKAGKDSFTQQEKKGYKLFHKYCNGCHTEPLFSNYQFASNGLQIDTSLKDYGLGALTHQTQDSFLFKIPSLRNLSYSYPYMHDGRFSTLYQVLKHYAEGHFQSRNLSPILKHKIELSPDQQTDLVAFLLCLNDPAYIQNPKNQFPKILLSKNEGYPISKSSNTPQH